MTKLSSSRIERLLARLNEKLQAKGVRGELYLVGGAVMCLVFKARAATQDLDGIFAPVAVIRRAAAEIAEEEGLETSWINDGVKGFLSDKRDFKTYLESSNLSVFTACPEYLLAMKCLAFRLGAEFHDEEDVRFLLRYLNIGSYKEALSIVTRYYPIERIPQKTLYALEEIIQERDAHQS